MNAPQISQNYSDLPPVLHAPAELLPVAEPQLAIANDKLAAALGISRDWLHGEEALKLLSGSAPAAHGQPLAMAYAGHQFGGFNASLGDGRAMLLGDVMGVDGQIYELHLKGTGRTTFSRGADGRATLSAMLREYIISEAMAALSVPTTRSLAVVSTGERVWRQRPEQGAVLTRVAKSHVRVGTFQYLAVRSQVDAIRALMEHEIARHMPGVSGSRAFLAEVIARQAKLIAQWMSFGFIHGVMNTDNMQIAGETIDYGPCAFMDMFHPQKVFSSIDENGRYAFDKQPVIALWNCTRLAECLLPLLDDDKATAIKMAEAELMNFMPQFEKEFERRMLAKLGISDVAQVEFITQTIMEMANSRLDFTQFFTSLTRGEDVAMPDAWKQKRNGLLASDAQALMAAHNPVYIARNHRVEEALAAAGEGNLLPLHRLLLAVQQPFIARAELAELEKAPGPQEEVLQTFCGT
ncbi:protein adenylyltransferase SelO [Aestuariivirga litoralis]|uniref:protein adenylyltransferase SelO n=1 Tax=Aestuariivirga litoralis TaxID=2650924 RepID=UPI0018C67D28|nr:YdiU family protein [Aestuariivirga litoralis]MBG1232773.1 YdiU family protein [Aestuariivirga litoralis]